MISQLTYVFQLICSTKLFSSSLQRYFCIYFRFYSIPYWLSILHSVPFYFSYFLLSISTSFPLQLLLFSSNSLFFSFFPHSASRRTVTLSSLSSSILLQSFFAHSFLSFSSTNDIIIRNVCFIECSTGTKDCQFFDSNHLIFRRVATLLRFLYVHKYMCTPILCYCFHRFHYFFWNSDIIIVIPYARLWM